MEIRSYKETPFLSQKKLHKGASKDYLEKARAWNDTVKEYNTNVKVHLEIEPKMEPVYVKVKKELQEKVKESNREVKKITPQAIEFVKEMSSWVRDHINAIKTKIKKVAFCSFFISIRYCPWLY